MFVNISVKNTVLTMMLAAGLFFGSGTSEIKAAWGDLDTSFATGGIYEDAATGNRPLDVILQTDGKILLTGYNTASNGKKRFMLRRFTANGALDMTFGNGGFAVINALINVNYDYAGRDITLLSGGKIAVVGQAGNNVAVWVVNSNGSGDTAFGYNGMKTLPDYTQWAEKIVTSGSKPLIAVYDGSLERIVLVKLNPDGTTDTTYGTNGVSQTNLVHRENAAYPPRIDMLFEGDTKKTVIVGLVYPVYPGNSQITLDRKNSNGSDDFSFTPYVFNGYFSVLTRLVRLSDGGYVYERSSLTPSPGINGYITKLNNNGTFNSELFFTYGAFPVGVRSDGKLVIGSYGVSEHYRSDNNLNLLETAQFPNPSNSSSNEILQPDNKIIQFETYFNKLRLTRRLAN